MNKFNQSGGGMDEIMRKIEDVINKIGAGLEKFMPKAKMFFVISIIIIFAWIAFVYMLGTFNAIDGWGADAVKWAGDYIFFGTIILNVVDTILKQMSAESKASKPGSKKGGSNVSYIMEGGLSGKSDPRKAQKKQELKLLRDKFTSGKNTQDCAPISKFINKLLKGILTMGVIYFSSAFSLSFIEIIVNSSEQSGSCGTKGAFDVGSMINAVTNKTISSFLLWFLVYCIILIILGGLKVYYFNAIGKPAKFLPIIRDKISDTLKMLIMPLLLSMFSLYIVQQLFTNPFVSFINGGTMTKISTNPLNILISILIFVLSLLVIWGLIQGGREFVKSLIENGRKIYINYVVPYFGIEGKVRKAENNASMCKIKPYWEEAKIIKSKYK